MLVNITLEIETPDKQLIIGNPNHQEKKHDKLDRLDVDKATPSWLCFIDMFPSRVSTSYQKASLGSSEGAKMIDSRQRLQPPSSTTIQGGLLSPQLFKGIIYHK